MITTLINQPFASQLWSLEGLPPGKWNGYTGIHRIIDVVGNKTYHLRITTHESVKRLFVLAAPYLRFGFTAEEMVTVLEGEVSPSIWGPLINYVDLWRLRTPYTIVARFRSDDVIPMTEEEYRAAKKEHKSSLRATARFERQMEEMEKGWKEDYRKYQIRQKEVAA
jgi:hypothetical protein